MIDNEWRLCDFNQADGKIVFAARNCPQLLMFLAEIEGGYLKRQPHSVISNQSIVDCYSPCFVGIENIITTAIKHGVEVFNTPLSHPLIKGFYSQIPVVTLPAKENFLLSLLTNIEDEDLSQQKGIVVVDNKPGIGFYPAINLPYSFDKDGNLIVTTTALDWGGHSHVIKSESERKECIKAEEEGKKRWAPSWLNDRWRCTYHPDGCFEAKVNHEIEAQFQRAIPLPYYYDNDNNCLEIIYERKSDGFLPAVKIANVRNRIAAKHQGFVIRYLPNRFGMRYSITKPGSNKIITKHESIDKAKMAIDRTLGIPSLDSGTAVLGNAHKGKQPRPGDAVLGSVHTNPVYL